jgi:hypothetical protein
MKAIQVKISEENVSQLVNAGKIHLQVKNDRTFPVGNADVEVLKYVNSVQIRPATQADIGFLLECPAKTIYITPSEVEA